MLRIYDINNSPDETILQLGQIKLWKWVEPGTGTGTDHNDALLNEVCAAALDTLDLVKEFAEEV